MFSSQESQFEILMDLNGFIQHLLAELGSDNDHLIQDNNPYLLKVCFSVEKILSHHLKDVNIIGQTTIWDFLQNLPKCLPGTSGVIDMSKECSKTSIGRARVFIRSALNTGTLGDYISSLTFNNDLMKTYYKDSALLKNSEFINTFQSLLDSLSHINFGLAIKDKELDKITYWEDIAISLLSSTPKKPTIVQLPQQPVPTPITSSNDSTPVVPVVNTTVKAPPVTVVTAPTISTPIIESNIESLISSEDDLQQQQPKPIPTTPVAAAAVPSNTSDKPTFDEQEKRKFYDSRKSLNLDELNDVLDDVLDDFDDQPSQSGDLQQQNKTTQMLMEYEILVDSLAKTKKSVILEYGAKGSPLTVSDQCVDSLCFAIDQVISHEILDVIPNPWHCVMKVCQGSQDIMNIQALHSTDSVRIKSWYFKSLTESTLSEAIRLSFSDEPTLRLLYKPEAILLQKPFRTQIYSTLSDLLSTVQFQLKWNVDLQPPQSSSSTSSTTNQLTSSSSSITQTSLNTSSSNINPPPTGILKKIIVTKVIKKKIKKTSSSSSITNTPIKRSNDGQDQSTLNESKEIEPINFSNNNNNNSSNTVTEESQTSTTTSPYVSSPPTQSPDLSSNTTPTLDNHMNINNTNSSSTSLNRISSLVDLNSLEKDLNSLEDDEPIQQPLIIDNYGASVQPRSILTEMMQQQQQQQQQQQLPNNNSNSSLTSSSIINSQGLNNNQSSISSMDDDLDPPSDTASCSSYSNSYTNIHDVYNHSKSYQPNNHHMMINNNNNNNNRGSTTVSSSLDYKVISDYFNDDLTPSNSGSAIPTIRSSSNNLALKDGKNRLEGDDGIYINQLFRKPKFTEMNNQLCPSCNAFLDKLGFFKVRFCYYTGKHFCNNCHHNEKALIPARILFRWDFKLYTVSDLAKTYLTIHQSTPFDIFQFNPDVYNLSSNLQRVLMMRRKLFFIYEYIETCRNKAQLSDQSTLKEYFIKDDVNLYSLFDLDQVSTGLLENVVENALLKYVHHVSKTCETCRGKGFICEYCGDGDNLIFSWMKLDINLINQCEKCHSLSHKKCGKKATCPKCVRIDRIKSRSVNPSQLNASNSGLNFSNFNHNNLMDSPSHNYPIPQNNNNNNNNNNNMLNSNFNITTSNNSLPKSNFSNINWI
ncbi:RUN domain-containing protein [Tieghemostelium lacteum]|uniref:RUN domain-containing protein n=1 Tax=Tieghemostelium lacteum TaxID=361077 RepID=A0A152A1W3_TIELA|nr:RUN domain-containing protein [Tieghemostelium lacteum]|eukprot:KYR00061.1 RUN domain-containing protein [Tieghemostelium lacteum]